MKEPPPINRLRPEVPAELAAVVHKMLQKKPADRYSSVDEVFEALAAFDSEDAAAGPVVDSGTAGTGSDGTRSRADADLHGRPGSVANRHLRVADRQFRIRLRNLREGDSDAAKEKTPAGENIEATGHASLKTTRLRITATCRKPNRSRNRFRRRRLGGPQTPTHFRLCFRLRGAGALLDCGFCC